MFYRSYSLSFLLFYICHLLVNTVINGQRYPQPQLTAPQSEPRQAYGYHLLKSLPDGDTQFYRGYNLTDKSYSEHLYTKPQTYARPNTQPLNHQLPYNQGYLSNGRRSIVADPGFPQSSRYRSLPLPPPMARPNVSPVGPPMVSTNIPRYAPILPQNSRQNQPNYQPDYRAQYRNDASRYVPQRQTVSGNEMTIPHSYNVRDEPMNKMIDYFSTDDFRSNVQKNKLTTVNLFQDVIIGTNTTADEAIIKANFEKTNGHIFDNGTTDCKPVVTVVKFGNINQPEIIYNPSSVQVLRCPQACFSWQFDCIPVKKTSYNFTAAVYTMEKDKVTREINQFEVISHTECACQCKTVASCLSHPSLSNRRPISN